MESPQPKHWNNSFERVFTVIFVLIGLYLAFSFMPVVIAALAFLVPFAVVAAAVYILWRAFSR